MSEAIRRYGRRPPQTAEVGSGSALPGVDTQALADAREVVERLLGPEGESGVRKEDLMSVEARINAAYALGRRSVHDDLRDELERRLKAGTQE